MILKEAFRYQNYLTSLFVQAMANLALANVWMKVSLSTLLICSVLNSDSYRLMQELSIFSTYMNPIVN